MKIRVKKATKVYNGKTLKPSGPSVEIDPGEYEVEEIPHPWFPKGDSWFVLKGTKVGATRDGWECRGAIFEE